MSPVIAAVPAAFLTVATCSVLRECTEASREKLGSGTKSGGPSVRQSSRVEPSAERPYFREGQPHLVAESSEPVLYYLRAAGLSWCRFQQKTPQFTSEIRKIFDLRCEFVNFLKTCTPEASPASTGRARSSRPRPLGGRALAAARRHRRHSRARPSPRQRRTARPGGTKNQDE